jgi:flagellar biosynthesis/type III secretory pathway protein FliH
MTGKKVKKISSPRRTLFKEIRHKFDQKIILEKVEIEAAPKAPQPPAVEAKAEPEIIIPSIPEEIYRSELENVRAAIKQQAERELEDYRKDAFAHIDDEKEELLEKAFQEGFERGTQEGEKQFAEKSNSLLRTIDEAIREKNRIVRDAKKEILQLALKAAEQIIAAEIALSPAAGLKIVDEAMKRITDTDKVIVRVAPKDLAYVQENKGRLSQHFGEIKQLIIQEDKKLAPGGCIIETKLGYIDSTLSTKMEVIEKALMAQYEEDLAAPQTEHHEVSVAVHEEEHEPEHEEHEVHDELGSDEELEEHHDARDVTVTTAETEEEFPEELDAESDSDLEESETLSAEPETAEHKGEDIFEEGTFDF